MKKFLVTILLIIGITLLGGSLYAANYFDNRIEEYHASLVGVDTFLDNHQGNPFINDAEFVVSDDGMYDYEYLDEKYSWQAPEGFRIISYSAAWDTEMLELLYQELMKNTIGTEIELLYEIVIYPDEQEDHILGVFSPFTASMDIMFQFPALPEDFALGISRSVGRIVLNGGDVNTTIESMASTLSHEYGHLFTFYHMFDLNFENVENSEYARIRGAARYGFITDMSDEDLYRRKRHLFLIEIAAEDYVQLMGSPTTRQVGTFVDIRQMLMYGVENPPSPGRFRNAFPQENMMIPLATEVPGLKEFFFSFVDVDPVPPVEERMEITLDIRPVTVTHDNLVDIGSASFTHYVITWNTPYAEAIYTLAFYDPDDYSIRGPIRTVFPGREATATIGAVTRTREGGIVTWDDSERTAQGRRVFYVVAQLPDGTFFLSEKLFVEF